jgi:hypothetical protein
VLGLFRKGRIDEAALDCQLDEIQAEEESLRTRLAAARTAEPEQEAVAALANVPAMLERLREKLDAGVTWNLKRQLVEVLVDGITVETTGDEKSRQAVVNVRYRFVSSVDTCTDRSSLRRRDRSPYRHTRDSLIAAAPKLYLL